MDQKVGIGFGILNKFNSCFDKETGWFLLENDPWVIYFRLFNHKNLPRPSHCHQDFGSPVIFHKNREIIIDPGRSSYLIGSNIESLASNHSIFLINSKPTAPSERDIPIFIEPIKSFKYKIFISGEKIFLFIRFPLSMTNQSRVKYAIRLLIIQNKSIEIIDRIALLKESFIKTRFNFPNQLNPFLRKFNFRFDDQNSQKIIINDDSEYLDIGERALEYNNIENYKTFNLSIKCKKFFGSNLYISE